MSVSQCYFVVVVRVVVKSTEILGFCVFVFAGGHGGVGVD